jgi:NADPH-dependent 2,4-dienoyl-CoA reductase/sulfur reductase-like enzyme
VLGIGVTATNIAVRTVTLSDDKALPFAKLVFATSSRPICLHIAGADLPACSNFRELSEVASMSRASCRSALIVVIGGGLLGVEAAYGLAKANASVILIHLMDSLMERARRLQLARQHRQSKYVLEHIRCPSQLDSGDRAWICISQSRRTIVTYLSGEWTPSRPKRTAYNVAQDRDHLG